MPATKEGFLLNIKGPSARREVWTHTGAPQNKQTKREVAFKREIVLRLA
jgi:hypothetical protein